MNFKKASIALETIAKWIIILIVLFLIYKFVIQNIFNLGGALVDKLK